MQTVKIDFSEEIFIKDPLWPDKISDIKEAIRILDENTGSQFRLIEHFEEKGDDLRIEILQGQ